MKHINLAGPPGIQEYPETEESITQHSTKTVLSQKEKQKKISKKETSTEKAETGKKKKRNFIKILRNLALAFLSFVILYILGDYIYNNFIKSQNFSLPTILESQKQTENNSRAREIDRTKKAQNYENQINNGQLLLDATANILSAFTSNIFIETLYISAQSVEGKIYFIDKKAAVDYEEQLLSNLPGLKINNYEINELEGFLPFQWSVYTYLGIEDCKLSEKIEYYKLVSDKNLTRILSSDAKRTGVRLNKFWISSPNQQIIRDYKIRGYADLENLSRFFTYLADNQINIGYNHINLKTDIEKDLIKFEVKGKIYPGKN